MFKYNVVSLDFYNFDLLGSSAPPEDIELEASPEESQLPKHTEIQPLLSTSESQPLYDQNKDKAAQEEEIKNSKIR